MSKYIDGSDEPATYGQALVVIAEFLPITPEGLRLEVIRAVQTEHDLVPAEVTPVYQDSRDQTISQYETELVELRRQKAARELADKEAADLVELEQLRAERDAAVRPELVDA